MGYRWLTEIAHTIPVAERREPFLCNEPFNRAMFTFNVGHFAHLHTMRIAEGGHHAGIIVSSQRPISEVIRRLLHLASTLDAESMRDRLEFLSDW